MSLEKSCVYIVDDDKAVSGGIKRLVESIGLEAAVFSGGQEFLDAYDGSEPGCLVLDIRMPDMNGITLQSKISGNNINIPIIFLTGHGDVPTATKAFKGGAFDFFEKPFNEHALLERIQQALATDLRERDAFALRHEAIEKLKQLSDRERQVLDLVMAGKPNKVIAMDLELSQSTIEVHRANVMKKMKADSLAQLVTLVNMAREKK
jgi:two-component system response regulator FixJ